MKLVQSDQFHWLQDILTRGHLTIPVQDEGCGKWIAFTDTVKITVGKCRRAAGRLSIP